MREMRRAAVGLTTLVVALGGTSAFAAWRDSSAASMSISTGSLVAATGLSATPDCTTALPLLPRVTLSWTPTVSTQATGYRIFRKIGTGSYLQIATVSGASANGYLDTVVSLSTTYTYYVRAYVGAWTADSSTASATTTVLCL